MKVLLHEIERQNQRKLKYVVITALYKGKWVCVRHRDRDSWEFPGGHIELDESPLEAAKRELYEETGALDFHIEEVCDYSVSSQEKSADTENNHTTYGRLYFCRIKEIGELPDSEIEDVKVFSGLPDKMTYEAIQPILFQKVNSIRLLIDREV
ncbi:NUDIX hydrolase [Fusibacter sp. JL216-2]|uniref:NUDIX hydrolase n=1 Tax=Fusibacter sp. JL216-2 TaxID=3071453 RepID=UPI003D3474EC